MWAAPGRLYLFLPFVSLLVHLCGANRVYWVHFHSANAAPLLIGLAIFLTRWRGDIGRRTLAFAQCTLALTAVLVSMPYPLELMVHAGPHVFSPLRLSLIGSAGAMAITFLQSGHVLIIQIAAAQMAAAFFGNSTQEMRWNVLAMMRTVYHALKRLIPETPMQWGILAVIGSFVMLAMGAAVSLRRKPIAPPREVGTL